MNWVTKYVLPMILIHLLELAGYPVQPVGLLAQVCVGQVGLDVSLGDSRVHHESVAFGKWYGFHQGLELF